jgi:hypothetical protein
MVVGMDVNKLNEEFVVGGRRPGLHQEGGRGNSAWLKGDECSFENLATTEPNNDKMKRWVAHLFGKFHVGGVVRQWIGGVWVGNCGRVIKKKKG